MRRNKQFKIEEIDEIIKVIRTSIITRIKQKGNDCYNSLHECWGILDEEVTEFKTAVHKNDDKEALKELIDVATAAILGIASESN